MYLLLLEAKRLNQSIQTVARLRRDLRTKLKEKGIKTSVEATYQHLIELLNKQ